MNLYNLKSNFQKPEFLTLFYTIYNKYVLIFRRFEASLGDQMLPSKLVVGL
jgi:hypothetical protein